MREYKFVLKIKTKSKINPSHLNTVLGYMEAQIESFGDWVGGGYDYFVTETSVKENKKKKRRK